VCAALLAAILAGGRTYPAFAEGDAPVTGVPMAAAPTLDALAWLQGCWRGAVNQREFREHWLPLRGGMMLGASHVVMQDRTQDFDYLRLETRADGVYYVISPSGKPEMAFRLTGVVNAEDHAEYAFIREGDAFPQRIVYRRGTAGWLYATVEGKLNGSDTKVTYPMRRVGCESGEVIAK
jgi:hypothetical protein